MALFSKTNLLIEELKGLVLYDWQKKYSKGD